MSLGNLLMLHLWAGLLDPATTYFLDAPRPWQGYAGTLVVFGGLAAAAAGLALVARRSRGKPRRAFELAFFTVLSLALFGTREQIGDLAGLPVRTNLRQEGAIGLGVMSLSVALFLVAFAPGRIRGQVRRAALAVLLFLSPFVVFTAGQATLAAIRAADGTAARVVAARPPAPRVPHADGGAAPRVLVLVLDEWDQFLTFDERTPGLVLPALDALIAESIHFTRAETPGLVTEVSLPSVLSGRRVVDTGNAGGSDRLLRFEDGSTGLFSDVPTFFTHIRDSGRNAGLTGWYHPYCRVFGDELVECSSRSIRGEFAGMSLAAATVTQGQAFFESFPQARKVELAIGIRPVRLTPKAWHAGSWRKIHDHALRLAADPTLDVVFAHYPLPHPPWLTKEKSYDGNLKLLDRCLAELRESMEGTGVWDRTSVILLADHPKRTKGLVPAPSPRLAAGEIRPVPFVLRVAGGGPPVSDPRPLQTIILHDLVLELTEDSIHTPEELDAWLLQRDAYSLAPQASE